MNAVLRRKEESAGQARMEDVTVVTCSAGNMGQAVSYAAKVLNCRASVVIAPDSAPKNKVDKMRHETFGFDEARQVHGVVTSQLASQCLVPFKVESSGFTTGKAWAATVTVLTSHLLAEHFTNVSTKVVHVVICHPVDH